MSSVYRLLCLSHNPAIVLDHEYHSGSDGLNRAVAALRAPVEGHPHCDLAIGRYSYPLVEVGIATTTHRVEWVDADWLRLLWHAHRLDHEGLSAAATRLQRPWTRARLDRLGPELGLDVTAVGYATGGVVS